MKIEKKDLEKSQIELTIELSLDEFKPYIENGAKKISKEMKIEGFRPGKAPYDIVKQKVGEMSILEEAARLAINKTIDKVMSEKVDGQPVGQMKVDIIKLAPGNPLEYKVVLAMLPKITLGEYKNANIEKEKVEITEDETNKMLENMREMRAKEIITEKEIKNGYKTIVDIEMFLDNVPIDGGQSKGVSVIIGKEYLVPGFDKKLIGAKKNDIREFKLPYPENHHQKNLSGKLVEFKITIKEVYERQLPELNDEFAKNYGVKNIEELKENIKKSIKHEKDVHAEQKFEIKIIDNILEKTKFGDLPEILINHEAEGMIAEMDQSIKNQGGKFEDYLASIKKTREELMLDMAPNAIKRVKSSILIREISIKEKININENEIDKKIEKLLEQYKGYEKVADRVKEPSYRSYLKNIMINEKVINKLKEWNTKK